MELLDRYDAEMRAEPSLPTGMTLTRIGGVVRLTGPYNLISYAKLPDDEADAYVAREAAFFRALGEAVEWKVHGHDRPRDLGERLERAGFHPDPPETLLVFDLAEIARLSTEAPGVTVRGVGADAVPEFLAATEAAFGRPSAFSADELLAGIEEGSVALHIAYAGGEPVAAGRVELPPGRSFAGLYSGGVALAWRGRGVYRALVQARAAAAAAAGRRYLITEALETSRPILERLGFIPMTTVQGWVLEP